MIVYVWCGYELFLCDAQTCECVVKMEEDQWMYSSIMSEEVDMNEQNEDEAGVNEEHVDCSDVFNTSQVLMWFIVIKVIKWMSLEN